MMNHNDFQLFTKDIRLLEPKDKREYLMLICQKLSEILGHSTEYYMGLAWEANRGVWSADETIMHLEMSLYIIAEALGYKKQSSTLNIINVNILIPNKVVEVTFDDGSKTKSVCLEPDVFSLETAISICLAKKSMGGSSTYHKAIRNGVKVYEDKLKKEATDQAEKERVERKRAKRKAERELRVAKREQAEREKQIAIQKEAYIQAMETIIIKDLVAESVEKYSGILKNMGKALQDQMKFCEENNNYKCGVYVRHSTCIDYVVETIKLLLPPNSQAEITNNQNGTFIKYPNGSLIRIISVNSDIRGYRFNGAIIDCGIGRKNIDTIISLSLEQFKTENDIYDCTDNPIDRVYYCG